MKSENIIFGVLLACALCASFARAEELKYVLPGVDEWTVEARPQDKIAIKRVEDIMVIDFTAKLDSKYRVGHKSFVQSSSRLLLKKPIKLDKKIKRIFYEAKGMQRSSRNGQTPVLLMPILQDANGETLTYYPQEQQHLMNATTNWCGWKTHSFYSTEAGGAADTSFSASGGDGNSWPDGELTFMGFELAIRSEKELTRTGQIEFGGYALGEYQIAYKDPYLYVDAVLKNAGKYQIASQIFNQFQDTPIRESTKSISFDPKRPSLSRQKITFQLGPNDNYWIRYQITDVNQKIVVANSMRYWVEGNPDTKVPDKVDIRKEPVLGYLRMNPGHKTCGVYQRNGNENLFIRAFAKGRKSYQIKWRIERFAFPEVVKEESRQVTFNGKDFIDINLPLSMPAECDAYRLIAEVVNGKEALDKQEYVFGFKTDTGRQYTNRRGPRTTREDVKKSAYVRISYLPARNGKEIKFKSRKEYIQRFDDALREISQVTPNVTYVIDTASFEVLPGVFDFETFDQVMDKASDYGCRLTIRLSHNDKNGQNLLRWQRYWPQRNADGTINYGHRFYGSFSSADPDYIATYLKGFQEIYKRYCKHPAFQGYEIFEIAGEWAVLDAPWSGYMVTYEEVARKGFINYVRKHITRDLKKINKRWQTSFLSWDKVIPPQPELETGATPDLRPYWMDFLKYKHYLDTKHWLSTAASSIRTYDKECVIIVYNLDPGGFDGKDGVSNIDYLQNGGNHFLRGEGSLISSWTKRKVGWITEPHMPHRWAAYGDSGDRGWLLDWTTYIMLAQAGGGGANMHIYYWPLGGKEDLNLVAHYGREYAFDRFEQWMPILREMHGIRLKQSSPQIAVMQDIDTLYCKHRTVFEPRMDDLRRWFELLKNDSLTYEDLREENVKSYKLILPNILDEVMSEKNIKQVQTLVRNGAKTVISAMTGSYCPEKRNEKFVLLSALGIKPPIKPFVTATEGLCGTINSGNRFFEKGKKINFYTIADMKKEEQSGALDFYNWPYRWLPQTDYFRVYPGHKVTDGKVLATFPDGGAAVSLHKYGKGEVLVFWGMPDYKVQNLGGFMQKVADWAGVVNKSEGNPVPLTLEGDHELLERHYAIMYQNVPGTYRQKLPQVPDGEYFVDDIVNGQRFGVFKSDQLHKGAQWIWVKGQSPLKILRMIPKKRMGARWVDEY